MTIPHAMSFKISRTTNLINEQDSASSSNKPSLSLCDTTGSHASNVDLSQMKTVRNFLQSRPSLQNCVDHTHLQKCAVNRFYKVFTPNEHPEKDTDSTNRILSLEDRIFIKERVSDYLALSPLQLSEQVNLASSVKQAFNYQDLYLALTNEERFKKLHHYILTQSNDTYSCLNQLDDQKYFERALATVWIEHELPLLENKLADQRTPLNLLHDWFKTAHNNKPYSPLSCRLLAFESKLLNAFKTINQSRPSSTQHKLDEFQKELDSIHKGITLFLRAGRVSRKNSLNPFIGWHNQAKRTINQLECASFQQLGLKHV